MSSWSLALTPCRENVTPASGGQVDPSHPIKMPLIAQQKIRSPRCSRQVCDWFCFGLFCFFSLSFVTNLYKRLSFLWKDAKRSFNPAPKSPYSAPLQVYTVAFVYKVQDHTFYRVTAMFWVLLIWGYRWGFVFDLVFFFCFLWRWLCGLSSREKWLLVQSMKILTSSQMSCLSNKWDYLWIYGIFHCVRCNLNRSGADLEIFYNTLGFVWIFFPQDLF